MATAKKGWSTSGAVFLAYGLNYPDALAGLSLAAKMKFPVLLLNPKGVAAAEKTYVKAKVAPYIYVFGGTGALSDAVVQSLYK